jgi:anti-anti-sigma factor
MRTPIAIEIEQREDVCILRFKGDFPTGEYSDYLSAKLDEIRMRNCAKVLADFRDVPSVGSTGLSFIVRLYKSSGGRLVLVRTQPRVREVLEITRLSAVIPLAADIESGLAALSRANHLIPV